MKLDELQFCGKSTRGRLENSNGIFPNVFVSKNIKKRSEQDPALRYRIRISFRCFDDIILDNTHCVYSIIKNRLYFKFGNECEEHNHECSYGYKIGTYKRAHSKIIGINYTEALSKFIRDKEYTPRLDSECGLWYIEY